MDQGPAWIDIIEKNPKKRPGLCYPSPRRRAGSAAGVQVANTYVRSRWG